MWQHMELTATNRSQAYPEAEKGGGRHTGVAGNTKWFQTWMYGCIALRSKGTDENVKHFWKYPREVEGSISTRNGRVRGSERTERGFEEIGWME